VSTRSTGVFMPRVARMGRSVTIAPAASAPSAAPASK
jgi:hypothetical protein